MRGRDGNVHRGRPAEGLLPMISHLGAMISVVNGILLARRFKKFPARRRGLHRRRRDFHRRVSRGPEPGRRRKTPARPRRRQQPIRLLHADLRQFACDDLVDKAAGYGVEAHSVDGTDLTACLKVSATPSPLARAAAARNWSSPPAPRLCGHGEHDDAGYVDPKLKNSPLGRDCLKVAEEFLLRTKMGGRRRKLAVWRNETVHEIEEAVAKSSANPRPTRYRGMARDFFRTS
jgi:acetoin:2,6-dichlorophenolindophenol oxidoreductase subunit alpha